MIDNTALQAAIAYFEKTVRQIEGIIENCTPEMYMDLPEAKAHFVVALEVLRRAEPANDPLTPCIACGYGGKHLDAPPCDTCPAWPKHPPKSAPITLEELREMDGEPVWVQEITPAPIDGDYWGVVDVDFLCENRYAAIGAIISPATNGVSRFGLTPFSEYGKTWLAYRRKPEGSDKEC